MALRTPSSSTLRLVVALATALSGRTGWADASATPTCSAPWWSSATELGTLSTDGRTATLCAWKTHQLPFSKTELKHEQKSACVRLQLDAGTYETVAWKPPPKWGSAEARVARNGQAAVCVRSKCKSLRFSAEDSEVNAAFDALEGRVAVSMPKQNQLVVFDTASGLAQQKYTIEKGSEVSQAFFVGESLLIRVEQPDGGATERLFTGQQPTAVSWFAEDDLLCNGWRARPKVNLGGDLWALGSLRPLSVQAVHAQTGQREWLIALPELDVAPDGEPQVELHIGLTPCSTMPAANSPLVRTPDGLLIYATPRGVALINPKTREKRTYPFPACRSPEP